MKCIFKYFKGQIVGFDVSFIISTKFMITLFFNIFQVFCLSLIGKTREDLKPLTSLKFLRALRVLSQFERMKVRQKA